MRFIIRSIMLDTDCNKIEINGGESREKPLSFLSSSSSYRFSDESKSLCKTSSKLCRFSECASAKEGDVLFLYQRQRRNNRMCVLGRLGAYVHRTLTIASITVVNN